jgi:UDPglucose--hexose-1-phosphate uridylyltransferase
MTTFDLAEHPHLRYNPLTGENVLVSPHRAKRPWQGQQEETPAELKLPHDPNCYLCAGNKRMGEEINPDYEDVFIFQNDFAALQDNTPAGSYQEDELIRVTAERGICRVVCFSPRHDLTLAEMEVSQIRKIVDAWQEQYIELGAKDYISYVQIFENKGAIMGCSNPHPHGQIWAQSSVPSEVAKETRNQEKYFKEKGKSLLSDYLQKEQVLSERIIASNDSFTLLVPFWAVWPFETMIVSNRHFGNMTNMTETEKDDFAEIIKTITSVYDKLFDISFPYSSGIHQTPTDGAYPGWHFHMHFYPPLLRSASVKKFMVGYELMGNPQRDITPEVSARMLRELYENTKEEPVLVG